MPPKTMFEKIWDAHLVHEEPEHPSIIYIDLHLVHEVTSAQAFDGLRLAGRPVRRTDLTVATADHNTPTWELTRPVVDEISIKQLDALTTPCERSSSSAGNASPSTSSGRTWATLNRARLWSAATATRPPTALWVPSRLASEPRKWSMCWPPRPCASTSPTPWK